MKIIDIIKNAIKSADMGENNTDKLINIAYYLGRHHAAVECCKNAKKIFEEQLERAGKSHFKHFAKKIIGSQSSIYHSDFSSDYIDTFGNDDFDNTLGD